MAAVTVSTHDSATTRCTRTVAVLQRGRTMVALGLVSVLHWARSESMGAGDLRLYLTVPFYPALVIPVILLSFRSRYTHAWTLWLTWILYVGAKIAEIYDDSILEWTGFWSGHTVKHLVAALATWFLLYALQHRAQREGGLDVALLKTPSASGTVMYLI